MYSKAWDFLKVAVFSFIEDEALSRGAAIALGYRVFIPRDITLPVMAHELAHVSQYEEWGALRYLARGAWNQIVLRTLLGRDVYRWDPEPGKPFAEYGM